MISLGRMGSLTFTNASIAISGTGHCRYLEEFYAHNSQSPVINMQIRYWIEAIDKFYDIPESEYGLETVEEAVLIVNCLANSLLILGGVNWSANGRLRPPASRVV